MFPMFDTVLTCDGQWINNMPKLACCIVKSGRYTACVCQGHIPKHCVRHRNPLKKKKTSCAEHCTDFSISNTPIYLSDTISASPSSCPLFWQTHSRGIRLHSLSRTERHVCATREGGGAVFSWQDLITSVLIMYCQRKSQSQVLSIPRRNTKWYKRWCTTVCPHFIINQLGQSVISYLWQLGALMKTFIRLPNVLKRNCLVFLMAIRNTSSVTPAVSTDLVSNLRVIICITKVIKRQGLQHLPLHSF